MTGGWFIIGFATLLWTFLHLVSTCFGWRIGRALKWSVTHLQHVCVCVPESKVFENIEAQWHAATCCKCRGNGHIVVVAVVDLRATFYADEISDSKTGTWRDVGTCWNTNLVMFAIVTRTRTDLFTVVRHTIVNPTHVNYFSICWIFFWGGRYCNLSDCRSGFEAPIATKKGWARPVTSWNTMIFSRGVHLSRGSVSQPPEKKWMEAGTEQNQAT